MLTMILSGLATGFLFAPLALGVYISYRLLRFVDITVDGTYALGGVLMARLLMEGLDPVTATLLAVIGGGMFGACTGVLVTRFGIQRVLAGILVMIALYSVNMFLLGKSEHSFLYEITLYEYAEWSAAVVFGSVDAMSVLGTTFFPVRLMSLFFSIVIVLLILLLLLLFFRTRIGLALRGAGNSESALRAQGANVPLLLIVALAVSNGLAALSGALMAQELGTAGNMHGVGMIVTGLACVMIGDAFFARRTFIWRFSGAIFGALIYRLLIALLMHAGLFDSDIKFFTAMFVVILLVLPRMSRRRQLSRNAMSLPE